VETGSTCHEASLLFNLPREVEKKLQKELKLFSLISGVQLRLCENCIIARAIQKKSISDVFTLICNYFEIQNRPFFRVLRQDKTERKKGSMKKVKQKITSGSQSSVTALSKENTSYM
jgi:hypothetical protein